MQQSISPKVLISVIAVAVLVIAVLAVKVFTAPSARPAPGAAQGTANPRAGGGPTEEQLKYMREYNAQHPGARSSLK